VPSIHIAAKGREGLPIKKFNNGNNTPSIHKDNLSRFIDWLLYCGVSALEAVLQMLAPAAPPHIYTLQCWWPRVLESLPFQHGLFGQ
jgi:hypothetical protein